MRSFLITGLVILSVAYALYRFYSLIVMLNKKNKLNKSHDLIDWQINSDPITRFFRYGTFKRIEIEKRDYKILKEDSEEDSPDKKGEN